MIDFTSQWSTTSFSAQQAVGAPNATSGFDGLAWAPSLPDGNIESIGLSYSSPVYAYGATIRENRTAGFVNKVEARDTTGVWHTVWQGVDATKPGAAADFFVKWPVTTYRVDGLRVYANTDKNLGEFELIDSVQLSGVTVNTLPAVSLEAVDTVASESFSSTGLFVFTRSLASTATPLPVLYNITGNAVNGGDYNSAAPLIGSIIIPAGANKVALFIKPVDDKQKEFRESVTLSLVNSISYQALPKVSTGTVFINSDE